jgi:hypothetical protein
MGHEMMMKDEKLIRNLRRRWPGILASVTVLIISAAALAFMINQSMKLDALVTPERISNMATFENLKEELPELFYRFHTLAACNAKLMFITMFFSCFIGTFLGFLIVQVADVTNRPLLVSMWDRIQRLEHDLRQTKDLQTDVQRPD